GFDRVVAIVRSIIGGHYGTACRGRTRPRAVGPESKSRTEQSRHRGPSESSEAGPVHQLIRDVPTVRDPSVETDPQDAVEMILEPALGRRYGPTLGELRKRLGGSDEGWFTDPEYGTRHRVDLTRWSHLPDDTRFQHGFRYQPPKLSKRQSRSRFIRSMLLARMPTEAEHAVTLDEILDAPIPIQRVDRLPEASFPESPWFYGTAR